MILQKNNLFLFISLILFVSCCFALDTDSQQRATLTADQASYNSHTGVGTYEGNVIVIQGTTKLTADRLVTSIDNKSRKLHEAVATGSPARFETVPKANDAILYASAKSIQYYPNEGYVLLIGDSFVIQKNQSLKAERIKYDFKHGVVTGTIQTLITLNPK